MQINLSANTAPQQNSPASTTTSAASSNSGNAPSSSSTQLVALNWIWWIHRDEFISLHKEIVSKNIVKLCLQRFFALRWNNAAKLQITLKYSVVEKLLQLYVVSNALISARLEFFSIRCFAFHSIDSFSTPSTLSSSRVYLDSQSDHF